MPDAEQSAQLLEQKLVYAGNFVSMTVDRVRLPGGHETSLDVVQHPGAAGILPVTATGEVILVRQYRYAASAWLWELPAGKLEPNEAPLACAKRELEEETGFVAASWQALGCVWPTPGFATERVWLYLATKLQATKQALEAAEILRVESVPLSRAKRMAQNGEIDDAKTLCALFRAEALLAANTP